MPTLDTLVSALAAALGPGWRAECEPPTDICTIVRSAYLIHVDGLRLVCRLTDGRLCISPDSVPMLSDTGYATTYYYDRPVITVAPTRPPHQLAADLRRRLLDDAATWWATATAVAANSCRNWAAFQARRNELLSVPGAYAGHDTFLVFSSAWRCDARYGDSVNLEFTGIDYADALAAIRIVESARAARKLHVALCHNGKEKS